MEAGEHVRAYLLARLARLPGRHTADGEERPAWHGAPGSRRALLEQPLRALRSGSGPTGPPQDGALALFLRGCPNRNGLSG